MADYLNVCPYDTPEGIEKLRQGDEAAWAEVYQYYSWPLQQDIFRSLNKRSLSDWSLEDIAQETWEIAGHKIRQFEWTTPGALYRWLRVISLYRILDRLPRFEYKDLFDSFDDIGDLELDEHGMFGPDLLTSDLMNSGIEAELVLREQRRELLKLVLDLEDPIHIKMAVARWVDGVTPREMSKAFGIKAGSVSHELWKIKRRCADLRTNFEAAVTTESSN